LKIAGACRPKTSVDIAPRLLAQPFVAPGVALQLPLGGGWLQEMRSDFAHHSMSRLYNYVNKTYELYGKMDLAKENQPKPKQKHIVIRITYDHNI